MHAPFENETKEKKRLYLIYIFFIDPLGLINELKHTFRSKDKLSKICWVCLMLTKHNTIFKLCAQITDMTTPSM